MNRRFVFKLFLLVVTLGIFIFPAESMEYIENQRYQLPAAESAKSFSRPYDSRFQYGLPEKRQAESVFGRRSQTVDSSYDDDEEVVLDYSNITPQRKIIKKISSDPAEQAQSQNRNDVPMNYDSFPKFYNANDMMNQQFMPTMSY